VPADLARPGPRDELAVQRDAQPACAMRSTVLLPAALSAPRPERKRPRPLWFAVGELALGLGALCLFVRRFRRWSRSGRSPLPARPSRATALPATPPDRREPARSSQAVLAARSQVNCLEQDTILDHGLAR
jgi:hypothetical protein